MTWNNEHRCSEAASISNVSAHTRSDAIDYAANHASPLPAPKPEATSSTQLDFLHSASLIQILNRLPAGITEIKSGSVAYQCPVFANQEPMGLAGSTAYDENKWVFVARYLEHAVHRHVVCDCRQFRAELIKIVLTHSLLAVATDATEHGSLCLHLRPLRDYFDFG